MNILIFDIETIPDIENGRKIYNFNDLPYDEALQGLQTLRRQTSNGIEFLPLHLQRIVAISLILTADEQLKIWSLGTAQSTEAELIQRFFDGIKQFSPILVSWNGCGFDLPVLHYRALLHGISASRYWETGDVDQNFRYNNYINRYHSRHMDLMDILASHNSRAYAPLDEISVMLGFPGKMGMNGKEVLTYFQRGEIEAIRNYCETDVLNTYLVYLRFELMRGKLTLEDYQHKTQQLAKILQESAKEHFMEFLAKWKR